MSQQFDQIFQRLKAILKKHAGRLSVANDSANHFCLSGGKHPTHKTAMPLMWVVIGKTYVSYHLMSVYVCPELLTTLSPKLKARMQGKSCFNFRTVDEELFSELDRLTAEGCRAWPPIAAS